MTEPYSIEFELDGLPKSQTNNYGHWRTRAATKSDWERRVHLAIGPTRKPSSPLPKARVTLTRCSSAPQDFDNLVASFKPILDGLVKAGVLEDDRVQNIGRPEYLWEKSKPKCGKIRVRVDEVRNSIE